MRALAQVETTTPWGADSEYGRLLDVLVCPPDNFHWLPASAIARATLDSGLTFSRDDALRQHAEMVSVYEEAGVRVHFLEPEPALPYQVFARDSSINVPQGPIVTQCNQWWRRGEYAPVIRFYQENEIPIHRMITAAALEGGDFMIVEPGVAVIGNGEERTQEPAARQLAGWLEADGWEVRIERIPPHFLHIDVLAAMLGEKLAAVCVEQVGAGFTRWLESKGVEIVPVTLADSLKLGVNGVCLGGDRVLTSAESKRPERAPARPRADGLRPRAGRVHARWRRCALPDAGDQARARGLTPARCHGGRGPCAAGRAGRSAWRPSQLPRGSGGASPRLPSALERHAQRPQLAVARPAQAAAVRERLLDVLKSLGREALAGQHVRDAGRIGRE